jgi:hypothetical protein
MRLPRFSEPLRKPNAANAFRLHGSTKKLMRLRLSSTLDGCQCAESERCCPSFVCLTGINFFYKSKSNLFFKMVLICVHVIEDRTLEAKKMERIETHSQESAGMNVSVESCFRDFYNVL